MGLEDMELTFLKDDHGIEHTHCNADCYAFGLWRRYKRENHWRGNSLPSGTFMACCFAADLSSLYAHYLRFVVTIEGLGRGLML
jgi:hypothetical protein